MVYWGTLRAFCCAVPKKQIERAEDVLEYQSYIRVTRIEVGKSPIYSMPDIMVQPKNGNKVALDIKYEDPDCDGWKVENVHQIACCRVVAQASSESNA